MSTLMQSHATEFCQAWMHVEYAVHKTAQDKGWWDTPREDGTCIALMHAELSEALEAFRKGGFHESDDKIHHPAVTVELADVVIRIMDYCAYNQLDIAQALVEKAQYNETREYRHGGKSC